MALHLQLQHANPCWLHSPLDVHVNGCGRPTRRLQCVEALNTSQRLSFASSMNGGRLGCGSLRSPCAPSCVARNRAGSITTHGISTGSLALRRGIRRRPGHVACASGGNGDGSNPLLKPLAWLVDTIFPGLAPKLRQEQQHDVPQQNQMPSSQQSTRPQQSKQQPQQQESQASADASAAQGDSTANDLAPGGPEPGFASDLQGDPKQPGFWNVGTQLGIFSGNGQQALNSVIERSNATDGVSGTNPDSPSRVAGAEKDENEDQLSWESWDQYMQQMDETSNRAAEVLTALDAAISDGRFEEAALLQKEANSIHAQNAVAVAHQELDLALEEQRFEDAARIRDESFTHMVGWWAGRGSDDPYGHLMYVCRSQSSYVGRVMAGAQVSEYSLAAENGQMEEEQLPLALQHGGMPLLELFLRRDEKAPHQMRHCPAIMVPNTSMAMEMGDSVVQMGGASNTFRIEMGDNGQMVIDSGDDIQGGNSEQVQGVLNAIVSAISDSMASKSGSDSDSSDEESDNSQDEEDVEEAGSSATLEQATAAEVLDSLRADIMRQLGAANDGESDNDEAIVIGSASDITGSNQNEFKRMFAEALKQVGLDQSEDGGQVVINVKTLEGENNADGEGIIGSMSRGRADLRFFGRDRFAIQACKDPWNPDAWNDSENDGDDDTESAPRSLQNILSSLQSSDPGSRTAKAPDDSDELSVRRPDAAPPSASPPATQGTIKIADFEESGDTRGTFSAGTRGRRKRPDLSQAPKDLRSAQFLREARAKTRAQSESQSESNPETEPSDSTHAETVNRLKEQNRQLKREVKLFKHKLRKLEQAEEASLQRRAEASRRRAEASQRGAASKSSIGSEGTARPVGSVGSQPEGVDTTELLMGGPVTYSRIPSLGTMDDLQGVFMASFGDHGSELLLMQRSTDASGQEWLTAQKLTGDPNVPAGEISFRAPIGRSKQLPPAAHMEMLGVTRRFKGEGRVASSNYSNPRWIPGELLQFSPNNPITRGAATGIVWNLPGQQPFLVVLHRIRLEEETQPLSNSPNRGT